MKKYAEWEDKLTVGQTMKARKTIAELGKCWLVRLIKLAVIGARQIQKTDKINPIQSHESEK